MGLRDRLRGLLRPGSARAEGRSAEAPAPGARDAGAGASPGVASAPVPTTDVTGMLIADVRSPDRFRAGHLPGAKNLLPADIAAFARAAPESVVTVCDDGVASSGVAERLAALGVRRAAWLDGGLKRWPGALVTEPVLEGGGR